MNLKVKNFKNIKSLDVTNQLQKKFFIYGENGSGKTSLLESIAYFSNEKYLINRKPLIYLNNGEKHFATQLNLNNKEYSYSFSLHENKNSFFINQKEVTKKAISEEFNIFFFETKKINNVLNYRKQRNDFFDFLLSKISSSFGEILSKYKKNLKLRNEIFNSNSIDLEKIQFYNQKLKLLNEILDKKRNDLIAKINKSIFAFVLKHNIKISLKLDYNLIDKSNLTSDDKPLRKDDYLILVDGTNIINFSSEGLSRITLLVIIFSIYEEQLTSEKTNNILLLDDVFSHLDEFNSSLLLNIISNLQSMVFLTHQHNLLLNKNETYLDKFFIKELR